MKLSIELSKWRCDRPDEWKMDEFIRNAEKLEAERDALALENRKLKIFGAEIDAIMRNQDNVWSRQISALCEKVDFAINQDTKTLLAAHDAEVAKAAYLACLAQCEQYFDTYYVGMVTEADAERYAASLNK